MTERRDHILAELAAAGIMYTPADVHQEAVAESLERSIRALVDARLPKHRDSDNLAGIVKSWVTNFLTDDPLAKAEATVWIDNLKRVEDGRLIYPKENDLVVQVDVAKGYRFTLRWVL